MRVEIRPSGPYSCVLKAADELDDFCIVIEERMTVEAVAVALADAEAGHLTHGSEAWISIEWLKSRIGQRDQSFWNGFSAMLSYASSKGWLSSDGSSVLGHLKHQDLAAKERK